jgi:hypothetical protein
MKTRLSILPFIALLTAALACNLSSATTTPLSPADIETLSAQTLIAMQWKTMMAQGTVLPEPGSTVISTAGPGATATNTLLPSVTSTVLIPSVTNTPVPCNWAQFISDITVPDGWETTPSDHFTKTWRLKNIGSCTWTSGYSLIFDHGDQMSASASQVLTPGTVAPGETIDVSVSLISPNIAGTFQGYFKLRASDSSTFGIGADANTAFWVKIKVNVVLPPPAIAPTTQIVSSSVNLAPGTPTSATVACPAGTVVTSGGFSVGLGVWVYTQLKEGNGWTAYAKNNAAVIRTLTTYAVCLTYPSVTSTQVLSSYMITGAGNIGAAVATCPAGSVATGGGYSGTSNGSLWTYFSSLNGNAWQVTAKNIGGGSITFNVYAICLSGSGLTTTLVFGNADIPSSGNGFAEVACPAGKVMTGGGFGLTDDLVPYFSAMSGSYWRVYAHNTGVHTRGLLSRAACLG